MRTEGTPFFLFTFVVFFVSGTGADSSENNRLHMYLTTVVAGAVGHAFSGWMPLDSFGPITFAGAATAAGPNAVRSIVCGALTPRDGARMSNPEFYAVIASFLRRTLVTGDFGLSGLRAVSLPYAEDSTDAEDSTRSLVACLKSLECGTQREDPLVEFVAQHVVDVDAVLARTCAVIRRHQHTLRRLKVPTLRLGALAFADALAECTAITSLDLSLEEFPFRSWQQLGPTLHTLKLTDLTPSGTNNTTFRLFADTMPALRELEFFILDQPPSQDGFIDLLSCSPVAHFFRPKEPLGFCCWR
jgi:hypothetical protein